ncbi:MAG: hypothetical protein ACRDVW_05400, partial [Acidimicrobiales bacterium]
MSREQDPRVPAEVEEYLVSLNVRAGKLGGSAGGLLGGGLLGAAAGSRGAARGAERGARRVGTVVEERSQLLPLTFEDVHQRVTSAVPRAQPMAAEGVQRLDVPFGKTGFQHAVV